MHAREGAMQVRPVPVNPVRRPVAIHRRSTTGTDSEDSRLLTPLPPLPPKHSSKVAVKPFIIEFES